MTSPARFSCSMKNAVGNCCRVLFACRTGAFLEEERLSETSTTTCSSTLLLR